MFGVDLRTQLIMSSVAKRPTCKKCGNQVDLSISDTEIHYLCGCDGKAKKEIVERTSAIISAIKYPDTIF